MTTTTTLADKLDELREYTAFRLANIADCSTPDSADSEGARFLTCIRDDVIERVEYDPAGFDVDDDGATHEIADNAPSVYTYTLWQQFVDLGAFNEDYEELGGEGQDMTALAGVCLYMIADRLVRALWDEIGEAMTDETDEDEEE